MWKYDHKVTWSIIWSCDSMIARPIIESHGHIEIWPQGHMVLPSFVYVIMWSWQSFFLDFVPNFKSLPDRDRSRHKVGTKFWPKTQLASSFLRHTLVSVTHCFNEVYNSRPHFSSLSLSLLLLISKIKGEQQRQGLGQRLGQQQPKLWGVGLEWKNTKAAQRLCLLAFLFFSSFFFYSRFA